MTLGGKVGCGEGTDDGEGDGCREGGSVGSGDGTSVGKGVGTGVGAGVGTFVHVRFSVKAPSSTGELKPSTYVEIERGPEPILKKK